MNWIAEIRKLFAELITFDFITLIRKKDKYDEFNKTIQLVKLYLNFSGEIDKEMLDSLNEIAETIDTAISANADVNDSKGRFESDSENIGKKYNEEETIKELKEKYEKTENFINSRPERESTAVRKMLNNKEIKA